MKSKCADLVKRKKGTKVDSYIKYQNFFKGFSCLNNQQKKQVQKNLDKEQVKFISSVVFCLLRQFLKIDEESKNKLKKHKKKLQILADNQNNFNRKRKILSRGGFLPALFSILASSIVPSAIDFILKKVSNQ